MNTNRRANRPTAATIQVPNKTMHEVAAEWAATWAARRAPEGK